MDGVCNAFNTHLNLFCFLVNGTTINLTTVEGEYFGENGFLTDDPRTASINALEPCYVCVLNKVRGLHACEIVV